MDGIDNLTKKVIDMIEKNPDMSMGDVLREATGLEPTEITGMDYNDAAEKMAKDLNLATEQFEPMFAIINDPHLKFLENKNFRKAVRNHKRMSDYHDMYGHASSYSVLVLHPEASPKDVVDTFGMLKRDLYKKGGTLAIFEGDEVISRFEKEFKKYGVGFIKGWKDEESDYRFLLNAAKTLGRTYEMKKIGDAWSYEIKKRE